MEEAVERSSEWLHQWCVSRDLVNEQLGSTIVMLNLDLNIKYWTFLLSVLHYNQPSEKFSSDDVVGYSSAVFLFTTMCYGPCRNCFYIIFIFYYKSIYIFKILTVMQTFYLTSINVYISFAVVQILMILHWMVTKLAIF